MNHEAGLLAACPRVLLSGALGMTLALAACAEFRPAGEEIKAGSKEAGHAVRDTTKEIGHSARDAAKEVGKGAKKVAKDLGKATQEAVHEVREELKDEE
jgi:gas vesicle protein